MNSKVASGISTPSDISNGDDMNSKKIHPFFTSKNAAKDDLSNTVTPVTPDPSCSPDSIDNDAEPSPPSHSRKRKRQQVNNGQDPSSEPTPIADLDSKPKKVLKLNRATGTIGSPPKAQSVTKKAPAKRGRKPKTLLALIRYGQDDDASRIRIGQHITDILANIQKTTEPHNVAPSTPSSRGADDQPSDNPDTHEKDGQGKEKSSKDSPSGRKISQVKLNKSVPPKATHPFFQGKAKPSAGDDEKQKPSAAPMPKKKVFFSSTPTSPKHIRPVPPKFNIPGPGSNSNILRVPGAQHPAWPSKEITHVRGDTPEVLGHGEGIQYENLPPKRKAKGQQVQISKPESILIHTTRDLHLRPLKEELKIYDSEEFKPPPPILRIPKRHFESGKKLQARVSGQLRTHRSATTPKAHAAITSAYNSIEKGLSAFDRATCETSTWSQKYAPSSAEQVLQSGREAELLRDWLENLKVLAIDTGTTDSKPKSKTVTPPKAKGKRKKKLDGFIVSSDDEMDELGEIDDTEGDEIVAVGQSGKKTVVRSRASASRDGGRFANAVVLSGPHGCGKTATVYAIAKELDFEVFEINSGSRRNGKDILEKVGDMTRNHLVQHRKDDAQLEEATTEDEVDRDLKSGKQGMMTTFFKPKTAPAQNLSMKPADPSITKEKKQPKSQKQSLILLEEVDVLYEEDKQFWATIISMTVQSKRPFVMTCTDESLIPLQGLNLHGIFRFSSPPRDHAVDLLLLIAANEGHALRRHSVETLYDARHHDLRASITELNYWCQIGVGDIRGGFDWFYPRWPKGKDIDQEGNTIRVVSEDTYQAGMGWLSRDSAIDGSPYRSTQEELHQQAYENWSLDTYETGTDHGFSSWAATAAEKCHAAQERLRLLESVDLFATILSDADIGSADLSIIPNQIPMDASIPSVTAKAKEDYTIGRQLLEAYPAVHYDRTQFDLVSSLKYLSRGRLEDDQPVEVPCIFAPLDEAKVTAKLEDHMGETLRMAPALARPDYSLAFDPIAASDKVMAAGYLDPSVFDGTLKTISLDVAPYVRSIVSYDQRLQHNRLSRSSLLSEGGQPGKKRMRTTRSALSALEGGSRSSTRRERYFTADINPHLVMRTGGKGWDTIAAAATTTGAQSPSSSEP
ncbi:hypothetical protein M426DRAFT_325218 [Hypoxylon sp. CI-4A]|nr:hypothetical protein M426DRAFT_325218 [Hypoxylon sp. CI-4A]